MNEVDKYDRIIFSKRLKRWDYPVTEYTLEKREGYHVDNKLKGETRRLVLDYLFDPNIERVTMTLHKIKVFYKDGRTYRHLSAQNKTFNK